MSFAERVVLWNRWYDKLPEDWRFQFVLWSLLTIGTINMLLTVAIGFPFALLVVLGVIAIAAIRVPYILGWVTPHDEPASDARFQIAGATWIIDLNRRYEAMPETRRVWVYPAVLLIGGAINMMLTISYGFPFGLLFLLTLLALILVRAPYTAGWLRDPAAAHAAVTSTPLDPALGHEPYPVAVEHEVAPVVAHDHEAAAAVVDHDASPVVEHDVSPPVPHVAAIEPEIHEYPPAAEETFPPPPMSEINGKTANPD